LKRSVITLLIISSLLLAGCNNDKSESVVAESTQTTGEQITESAIEMADSDISGVAIETEGVGVSVSEDVYSGQTLDTVEDMPDFDSQAVSVTDSEKLTEIQAFIEKFFYNYLFNENHLGTETGEITPDDMQLFAISYIQQFEHNELRFDTDKFILYIPEENVTEVIKRFFDYEYTDHKYPVNTLVSYEDGFYLMPVFDIGSYNKPVIIEATMTSDFSYTILFEEPIDLKPIDDPSIYYEAHLEERDGRFIMVEYNTIVVYPEETLENTGTTTQGE
jgi:hypothetical protein